MLSKAQSCCFIDSSYAFSYYIYDTYLIGTNSFSFVPTMSGLDSNLDLTVYTYSEAESATVTFEVIGDCLATVF